jgi:hypothetical protein
MSLVSVSSVRGTRTPRTRQLCAIKNASGSNRAMHVALYAIESSDIHTCVFDSGASSHMAADSSLFTELRRKEDIVTFDDCSFGPVVGICTVAAIFEEYAVELSDVLYVPFLFGNLFSVTAATGSGVRVTFLRNGCKFEIEDGAEFAGNRDSSSGLVLLVDTLKWEHVACSASSTIESSCNSDELWHQCFGHCGYSNIARMQKENLVDGMADFCANKPDGVCDICVQSKAKSLPFPRSLYQAEQPLDFLHVDLMGPFLYMAGVGLRYVMAVLDDHLCMSAAILLRQKSEATKSLITHIQQWVSVLGKNLTAFRSDNGSEFRNHTIDSFCDDNEIVRNFSVPRRPQ